MNVRTAKARTLLPMAALTLAACGLIEENPQEPEDDMKQPPGGAGIASAQELRVYIDEVQPEPVTTIRFKDPLRWKPLNSYFAIVETRDGPHLVEMAWECKELWSGGIHADMADRRRRVGLLQAKMDTLRGCRIENFYKLPEPKAVQNTADGTRPQQ